MKTPELDKMLKVRESSQALGAFLEWMTEQKRVLLEGKEKCPVCSAPDVIHPDDVCDYCDRGYIYKPHTIHQLLYEYFKIDENKAEQERRALLDEIRAEQGG